LPEAIVEASHNCLLGLALRLEFLLIAFYYTIEVLLCRLLYKIFVDIMDNYMW